MYPISVTAFVPPSSISRNPPARSDRGSKLKAAGLPQAGCKATDRSRTGRWIKALKARSEERRVGKEGRSRWARDDEKKRGAGRGGYGCGRGASDRAEM